MFDFISAESMVALGQVILIDLVLAGDNAIIIGLAAAGLPKELRAKAILIGIAAATLLRIAFAAIAMQLLAIVGILVVGGLLLLWVCWKMWRELRSSYHHDTAPTDSDSVGMALPRKTFAQAAWQILVADVSMSLDNVLAVAGAARGHTWVLWVGLGLSIALMGLASSFIAALLQRYRWIAYVGLASILYIALEMIWRGIHEVWPLMFGA